MQEITFTNKNRSGLAFITEEGWYEVAVIKSEVTIKGGKQQWEITARTDNNEMVTEFVQINNSETEWKIELIVRALGFLKNNHDEKLVRFQPEMVLGRRAKVFVKIEEYTDTKKANAETKSRAKIKQWVEIEGANENVTIVDASEENY